MNTHFQKIDQPLLRREKMTKDTETNLTDYALHRLLDSAKILAEYRAGESHGFWLHIDRTVVEKATAMLDEMLVAMEDEGV